MIRQGRPLHDTAGGRGPGRPLHDTANLHHLAVRRCDYLLFLHPMIFGWAWAGLYWGT